VIPGLGLTTPRGWLDDVRITFDGPNGGPKLAIDSSNNLHVVWSHGRHLHSEIFYKKLDSFGNILVDDLNLTNALGHSKYPSIAVDSNNDIHIVWNDLRTGVNGIYYTKLDGSGNTIIDDLCLADSRGNSAFPCVAVDGNKNVHIVWNYEWGSRLNYMKLDSIGNILINKKWMGTYNVRGPKITVDQFGYLHIVAEYLPGAELCYIKADNNGNITPGDITTMEIVLTRGAYVHHPQVALDSQNHVHIIWADTKLENVAWPQLFYMQLDDMGNVIGNGTFRLTFSGRADLPTIDIDSEGNIHIAYRHYVLEEGHQLYYIKLTNDGLTSIGEIKLSNGKGVGHPSLKVDHGDNIHIIWDDERDRYSSPELYYKRSQPNLKVSEETFTESMLIESLLSSEGTLSNVTASGDLNGTLNFISFENVTINTGPFAGQGFSKGEWMATLEGISYKGKWKGVSFLNTTERRIYLKGVISGDIGGIAEGYLTESASGSGVYDQFQSTCRVNKIMGEFTSATINLTGIIN